MTWSRRLLAVVEATAVFFLRLIALLTAGNVMWRDLLGSSIPDWYDSSRMLQGIALFWGLALATYYGSHICVDIVWEHLQRRGQRVLDIVATTGTLALMAPMAWMVWEKVASTGTQGTNDLRLPLVWPYALAAVGATVAALLCLVRLLMLIVGTAPTLPVDTSAEVEVSDGA